MMKRVGVFLFALSFLILFFAFNMDVVVGSTYNIGLLDQRQSFIYLFGILFLAGTMFFGFGVVVKEENNNIVVFSLWVFLTPIVLFSLIKIIANVSEYMQEANIRNKNAKEEAELAAIKAADYAREFKHNAEIAKIVKIKTERYVDNKNGTLTSKLSNLMWQRCSVGQTWTGTACSGEATKLNIDEALKLTNNLAGYSDWRLPSKDELMILIYCAGNNYDDDGTCEHKVSVQKPTINSNFFPNTTANWFWTSTPSAYITNSFLLISFENSSSYFSNNNPSANVRLVRNLNQ